MEELTIEQQNALNKLYDHVAELMIKQKMKCADIENQLIAEGLDERHATFIVKSLASEIKEAKKQRVKNNLIYGSLCLLGGGIGIFTNAGSIFWLAIIFGAIQITKGFLIAYNKE